MSNIDWARFRARDWLGAAATVFALAVTFNAEYEIAIAVHINPIVAYAVPGALDVYVLRALQVKRDVFLTVLAMVAVNAASHLVTAGVLRVSPALIVAVSAIAPLVLWRAHVLRNAKRAEEQPSVVVPPVPEHAPERPWQETFPSTLDEHADQAISVASTGAVNVSEHWCGHGHNHPKHEHKAYGETLLCMGCENGDYGLPAIPEHDTSTDRFDQIEAAWFAPYPEHMPNGPLIEEARVLTLVPPLPKAFEPVLEEGDKDFLDRARVLDKLTFASLKSLGMGNDRARRIKTYLEWEAQS